MHSIHKKPAPIAAILLLAIASSQPLSADNPKDYATLLTTQTHIVVLGASKNFPALELQARKVAQTMNMPFSLRGLVFDKKRGLIVPDDDNDDIWRGHYVFRREDTMTFSGTEKHFISIERSEAYPEMKPGYYFIMGGIEHNWPATQKRVAAFKQVVKDAYAINAKVYMGCMH